MSAIYERLGELDKAIAALELRADLRRRLFKPKVETLRKVAELKRRRDSRG